MDTEFEVKFYPIDKTEYRKKLEEIGAKLVIPERKMRRMIFDGRFHPEFKCDYIRVRDEGNTVRISAKIHAQEGGKISDQKEIDIEVNNFEKAVEIFGLMGLKPDRYQENLRETWEHKEAEITIDTWPWLGSLTEIEGDSEGKIKEVVQRLGLAWDKKIITSVIEIYAKVYNLSADKVLDKMSNLTFENNPFNQRTITDKI